MKVSDEHNGWSSKLALIVKQEAENLYEIEPPKNGFSKYKFYEMERTYNLMKRFAIFKPVTKGIFFALYTNSEKKRYESYLM